MGDAVLARACKDGIEVSFRASHSSSRDAKEHDKEGYWYPFQTAGTGVETDLFELRINWRLRWRRYCTPGTALCECNRECNVWERLLTRSHMVADFYVSMAKKVTEHTHWQCCSSWWVRGRDFHTGVKNSVYTNSIAALQLHMHVH